MKYFLQWSQNRSLHGLGATNVTRRHISYHWSLSRSSRQEVFCRIVVLENFTKFTGKNLSQSLFFIKKGGARASNLLEKRLWYRCFPLNFVKLLRTAFFIEHIWWLLLSIYICGFLGGMERDQWHGIAHK